MNSQSLATYQLLGCIVSAAQFSHGELAFYEHAAELFASDGEGHSTSPLHVPYESIVHFRVVRAQQLMRIAVPRQVVDAWAEENGFQSQLDPADGEEAAALGDDDATRVLLQQLSAQDMAHFLSSVAPLVAANRRARSVSRLSMTEPLPIGYYAADPSAPPEHHAAESARSTPLPSSEERDSSGCSHITEAEARRTAAAAAADNNNNDGVLSTLDDATPREASAKNEKEEFVADGVDDDVTQRCGEATFDSHDESLSERLAQLEQYAACALPTHHGSAAGPLLRKANPTNVFHAALGAGRPDAGKAMRSDAAAAAVGFSPTPTALTAHAAGPSRQQPVKHIHKKKTGLHTCASEERSPSSSSTAILLVIGAAAAEDEVPPLTEMKEVEEKEEDKPSPLRDTSSSTLPPAECAAHRPPRTPQESEPSSLCVGDILQCAEIVQTHTDKEGEAAHTQPYHQDSAEKPSRTPQAQPQQQQRRKTMQWATTTTPLPAARISLLPPSTASDEKKGVMTHHHNFDDIHTAPGTKKASARTAAKDVNGARKQLAEASAFIDDICAMHHRKRRGRPRKSNANVTAPAAGLQQYSEDQPVTERCAAQAAPTRTSKRPSKRGADQKEEYSAATATMMPAVRRRLEPTAAAECSTVDATRRVSSALELGLLRVVGAGAHQKKALPPHHSGGITPPPPRSLAPAPICGIAPSLPMPSASSRHHSKTGTAASQQRAAVAGAPPCRNVDDYAVVRHHDDDDDNDNAAAGGFSPFRDDGDAAYNSHADSKAKPTEAAATIEIPHAVQPTVDISSPTVTTTTVAVAAQPMPSVGYPRHSSDRKIRLREIVRCIRGVDAHVAATREYSRQLGDLLQAVLDNGEL